MSDHFAKFLEVYPALDLPAGKEATSAVQITDRNLYPRLYFFPQSPADIHAIKGLSPACDKNKFTGTAMEIDAHGVPRQLGYVDLTTTLRGLKAPYPTALVRALVYRNNAPVDVYILATQTPYIP